MLQLAHIADIFSHLNDLNISLQGHDKTVFSWEIKLMLSLKNVTSG